MIKLGSIATKTDSIKNNNHSNSFLNICLDDDFMVISSLLHLACVDPYLNRCQFQILPCFILNSFNSLIFPSISSFLKFGQYIIILANSKMGDPPVLLLCDL